MVVVARPMKFTDKLVHIAEIDLQDDTCRLSLSTDPNALLVSIKTLGLINPPVLRQRQDRKYQIVCGFRRITACNALGLSEIKVRVLDESFNEVDALKLAILDNRSHRNLSVVEQAQGIQKLSDHLPRQNRLEILSSLLGFPENHKVYKKIKTLSLLPLVIQAGVEDEIVSFEAAVDLNGFSHEDCLSFFELFKTLKLSQNKQREVVTLVQEIALRENLTPVEVLQSEEIRTILEQPELNKNEKGSKARAYLKRRRFPTLTKAEKRFTKELKALKLNEHFKITAPPYFEGGPHKLRMTFKSIKEFNECRKTLDAMAKNPAFKRLLEPFES